MKEEEGEKRRKERVTKKRNERKPAEIELSRRFFLIIAEELSKPLS